MKTLFGMVVVVAALALAGCQGEPSGDMPAPGVKVAGPNDPGPKPSSPISQPAGAGAKATTE